LIHGLLEFLFKRNKSPKVEPWPNFPTHSIRELNIITLFVKYKFYLCCRYCGRLLTGTAIHWIDLFTRKEWLLRAFENKGEALKKRVIISAAKVFRNPFSSSLSYKSSKIKDVL